MMHQYLFIIVLVFSWHNSIYGNIDLDKSYNDGPYILFEGKNTLRTVWVADGELFEKESSSKESMKFDIPSLPHIQIPEKAKWESKTKGKYKTQEKVVAISDIHGQYGVFVSLLQKHGIVDEHNNWKFHQGHLVIVGDVMDRGDRVLECLWLIHQLENQAESAGGKVHFLLGNHELMVMNGINDYIHPKYRYTSALLKRPYHELFSKKTALGKWLSSKNVLLQINDVLYVHGGISQQTMDLNLGIDAINSTFKKGLYYNDQSSIESDPRLYTLYYEDGPLWYRGYAYPYSFNKEGVDQTLDKMSLRSIVVGHTTLPKIKSLYDNKIILIDSSIKGGKSGQILINDNGAYSIGNYDGTTVQLVSEENKEEDRKSLFQYLYEQDAVSLTVSHDLKTINKNFSNGEVETEGQLSIIADGQQHIFSAAFKPGGKSRRKICRLPPLKMNLKKSELENFNFLKDHDKMKIVFQCQNSGTFAEAIKMEKFIYDLHEVVSPYGFRTKLVKVRLEGEKKILDGFVIESDDDIQYRKGLEMLKGRTVATQALDRSEYVKMCLFQYMIANSDWSARKGHNTDLFKKNEDNSLVVIPYDFDYSGIIDNNYAVPPENLPISDVTQRYFMDKNIGIEELKVGVEFYLSKEGDIAQLIETSSYLSDKSRNRIRKFIESFYKIIKSDKKVKKLIKS